MNRKIIAVAIAMTFGVPAFAQSAGDISALKDQLKMLQNRIEQLEREKTAAPAASAATNSAEYVTKGDIPGSYKLPGSKTSIALDGYIKAIGVYSNRGPLGNPAHTDEWFVPSLIPLSNTPEASIKRNYVKESAKESRIVVRTKTPTDLGDLTTLVEFDFYGTAGSETNTNSNGPRVRHAWGTLGNFGAGQFWSNMANMTAVPETIDFTPQVAIFGALRQTGFRWTQPFSRGWWSVAVENPESRIASNTTGVVAGPDNDKQPLFNGKVHFKAGPGEYELAGAAAKVNTAQGAVYSKLGTGISFSGFIPTFDKDKFMFGTSTTESMGRHTGLLADVVQVGSELRGIDVTSYFFGYKHDWSPKLRSTLARSVIRAVNPSGLTQAAKEVLDKRFESAHLNLIYALTPQAEIGGEWIHGYRQVESGQDGTLNRFMVMAKYKFQ